MKSILSFETAIESAQHEALTIRLMQRLEEFERVLKDDFQLKVLPKAVIWTSNVLATTVFSSIPIPAYTRQDFIYLSPELDVWRNLMIQQLDDKELPTVRAYFEQFGEDHLLEILAHELTHHIELFVDDFDEEREDSIWFEEGMCFYLPRKLLMSDAYFEEITAIEQQMVEAFKETYGHHLLDDFGSGSYAESLSSIMFDYWRSYLKVKEIVDKNEGDIRKVFKLYHDWDKSGRTIPLSSHLEK